MIKIKHLKELYRLNPGISAEQLIQLAEYYVEMSKECVDNIVEQGETVRICTIGNIKIKDYESEVN